MLHAACRRLLATSTAMHLALLTTSTNNRIAASLLRCSIRALPHQWLGFDYNLILYDCCLVHHEGGCIRQEVEAFLAYLATSETATHAQLMNNQVMMAIENCIARTLDDEPLLVAALKLQAWLL